jgi:plasmid stabilization system protein ParE
VRRSYGPSWSCAGGPAPILARREPLSAYQQGQKGFAGILEYIEADSLEAAARVEDAVLNALAFLASNPYAGYIRPQLTSRAFRFWPVQPFSHYLIVYDPPAKPLTVIRILHGTRDLRHHLK